MDLGLRNKKVVVTGGSAGIGRGIALAFANEGCQVSICGRDIERIEKIEQELTQFSTEYHARSVDITDLTAFASYADEVANIFRAIDIWVNNVGATMPKRIIDCTPEYWDYSCALNLRSVFFGSQFAMKKMIETNTKGVIINISSYAAALPVIGGAVYAALKSAIPTLTRSIAAECAPYGIRAVTISPGTTETEMTNRSVSREELDVILNDIASGRLGNVDDIAKLVVFTSSNLCNYVNGADIRIDGGKYIVQNLSKAFSDTNEMRSK